MLSQKNKRKNAVGQCFKEKRFQKFKKKVFESIRVKFYVRKDHHTPCRFVFSLDDKAMQTWNIA